MKYCPNCGAPRQPVAQWPHKCHSCKTQHFCSPKPVVALVLRAWEDKLTWGPSQDKGIVLIKRGIKPHKNTWAFPGGYIDHAEDWRQAAVREAQEELGVTLNPHGMVLWGDPVVTPTNYLVLFVGYSGDVISPAQFHKDPMTQTQGEIQEIKVTTMTYGTTLGVPSHQTFWKKLRLTPS